jgi:hypothetical protein
VPDVVLAEVDVHEAAELAVLVAQVARQPGVQGGERVQRGGDIGPLDRDDRLLVGKGAQGAGDVDLHGHRGPRVRQDAADWE